MPKSVRIGAAYDACVERERGAEVRRVQSGLRLFGRIPGGTSLMRIRSMPARSARKAWTGAPQRMPRASLRPIEFRHYRQHPRLGST
jgi:hypothetical protein